MKEVVVIIDGGTGIHITKHAVTRLRSTTAHKVVAGGVANGSSRRRRARPAQKAIRVVSKVAFPLAKICPMRVKRQVNTLFAVSCFF